MGAAIAKRLNKKLRRRPAKKKLVKVSAKRRARRPK